MEDGSVVGAAGKVKTCSVSPPALSTASETVVAGSSADMFTAAHAGVMPLASARAVTNAMARRDIVRA